MLKKEERIDLLLDDVTEIFRGKIMEAYLMGMRHYKENKEIHIKDGDTVYDTTAQELTDLIWN